MQRRATPNKVEATSDAIPQQTRGNSAKGLFSRPLFTNTHRLLKPTSAGEFVGDVITLICDLFEAKFVIGILLVAGLVLITGIHENGAVLAGSVYDVAHAIVVRRNIVSVFHAIHSAIMAVLALLTGSMFPVFGEAARAYRAANYTL